MIQTYYFMPVFARTLINHKTASLSMYLFKVGLCNMWTFTLVGGLTPKEKTDFERMCFSWVLSLFRVLLANM